MRDQIFTFESFINWWGDLIGMGSLEDHRCFGALIDAPVLEAWKFRHCINVNVDWPINCKM